MYGSWEALRYLNLFNFKGVPKEWPESSGGEMNIDKCSPQEGVGWVWVVDVIFDPDFNFSLHCFTLFYTELHCFTLHFCLFLCMV